MTEYRGGDPTQPLTAVEESTAMTPAIGPADGEGPPPTECEAASDQQWAYLVFNAAGEFQRLEFHPIRAEAICDDRRGVMTAVPILRDSRTRDLPEAEAAAKAAVATAALGEPLRQVA